MLIKPLVSIVIPTYNSATTLAETLISCQDQTYSPIEIIVVDDGSSDETVSIAKGYNARVIQQRNQGPGIARNTGIMASNGDFIKFCDADDTLYPDHIEKVMTVFITAPQDVALIYTRYKHVQSDGLTALEDVQDPPQFSGDVFCDILLSNSNSILTSAVTARRQALIDVGLFPNDETFRYSEDWDLFLRLALKFNFAKLPEILLNYRWHKKNISNNAYEVAQGRLRVWQRARTYGKREACLDDLQFDQLEAGRYHVLAIQAWKDGKRRQAREALVAALYLQPSFMRCVYYMLTYFLAYEQVARLYKPRKG